MKKKAKKRKIRLGGIFVIILLIYLLVSCLYYLWKLPIKNITIEGNYYLKDNYIINYLNISKESVIKISSHKIKKKLLELDLISDVKVRKNYLGKIKIIVTEDKVLFYDWIKEKIILSSGKEIDYNKEYLGIPALINYVPEDIYKEFIEKLNKVNKEALALVSEIEYSPSIIGNKTVDNKRFLFRMNDGNKVYINTINIEKFNNYFGNCDIGNESEMSVDSDREN